MGNGGVIGSPLARPYLHFAYNFSVALPLTLAFWAETKRICDRPLPHSFGVGSLWAPWRQRLAAS